MSCRQELYILASCTFICALYNFVILLTCLFQIHDYKSTKDVGKAFTTPSNLLISFLLLQTIDYSMLGIGSVMFYPKTCDIDLMYSYYKVYWTIQISFDNASSIVFLLFQIFRLYFSFQETVYNLSKQTIFILATSIILFVVGVIIFDLTFWNKLPSGLEGIFFQGSQELMAILLVSCPTAITLLFAIKLLKIVIDVMDSHQEYCNDNTSNNNNNDNNNNNNNSAMPESNYDYNISDKQVNLLDLIGKQTWLSLCQTIVECIWIVYDLIKWDYFIFRIMITVMVVLRTTSLWLTFVFAQKQYYYLCQCFHKCFSRCFQSIALCIIKKRFVNFAQRIINTDPIESKVKLRDNNAQPHYIELQ